MKTKEKILKDYISFRKIKNKTIAINDIENHIKWFINSKSKPLDNFNEADLVNYINKISKKYKTHSLNSIKSSFIKSFIKWYYEDWSSRFRNLDGICKTEKPEPSHTPEDMLNEKEFKELIKGESDAFWKAYFFTFFYGGCRPMEVCNLKWNDVDFNDEKGGAYISIYSAKNKRVFLKYVPSDVVYYLKQLKNLNSEWVFYNRKTKKPITKKGAYARIRSLSERVLGKKIHLYTLRHSIATIIYNKDNIKDDDLAKQMGHSISQKKTYLHNNKAKLRERARNIYVSAENLPEEKKHDLEIEIANLKHDLESMKENIVQLTDPSFKKFLDDYRNIDPWSPERRRRIDNNIQKTDEKKTMEKEVLLT